MIGLIFPKTGIFRFNNFMNPYCQVLEPDRAGHSQNMTWICIHN